jgi:hypothetical protein
VREVLKRTFMIELLALFITPVFVESTIIPFLVTMIAMLITWLLCEVYE